MPAHILMAMLDRIRKWLGGLRQGAGESLLAPYLEDELAGRLLRLLLKNPGTDAGRLAYWSGAGEGAVQAYLGRWEAGGLVERGADGYRLTEAAAGAVAARWPLNYQCPGMTRE